MNTKRGIALASVVVIIVVMVTRWLAAPPDPATAAPDGSAVRQRAAAITVAASRSSLRGGVRPAAGHQRSMRLEGQVVDADGVGVGGAKVFASTDPPSEVVAESDGSFAFERLAGRSYALTATAGALVGGPLAVRPTEDGDPVILRLVEGAALEVHVVDDRRRPVAAAQVAVLEAIPRVVETDETGDARVEPLRAGLVFVAVSAADHATARATAVTGTGATERIEVTLQAGHAVSGRVMDDRGRPIAGARVMVADGDPPVETDRSGGFMVRGVPAGTHTVLVSDGEHVPAASSPITVVDRAVEGVVIAMTAGGVVAGVVVGATGAPVPSAGVRIVGSGGRTGRTVVRDATSDAEGRFEVRGLPRIALQAQATSDRAAGDVVDIDLATRTAAEDIKLVIDPGGEIAGRVVDAAGNALPEVQVTAYADGGSGAGLTGPPSTMTDGAGAFTLTGLRTGTYRLYATSEVPGLRNQAVLGVPATPGTKGVRIALVSAAPIPAPPQ